MNGDPEKRRHGKKWRKIDYIRLNIKLPEGEPGSAKDKVNRMYCFGWSVKLSQSETTSDRECESCNIVVKLSGQGQVMWPILLQAVLVWTRFLTLLNRWDLWIETVLVKTTSSIAISCQNNWFLTEEIFKYKINGNKTWYWEHQALKRINEATQNYETWFKLQISEKCLKKYWEKCFWKWIWNEGSGEAWNAAVVPIRTIIILKMKMLQGKKTNTQIQINKCGSHSFQFAQLQSQRWNCWEAKY